MRLVGLHDGDGMGDFLYIFETNAPKSRLEALERESQKIADLGNYEDIPIWEDVLSDEGYVFDYVADHRHVTPYGTSESWRETNYPEVTEIYYIDY